LPLALASGKNNKQKQMALAKQNFWLKPSLQNKNYSILQLMLIIIKDHYCSVKK